MTKNQNSITHINLAKGFRGGERQTLLLVQELSKAGYTQTLITRKDAALAKEVRALSLQNTTVIEIAKPYFLHLQNFKNTNLIHAHETKGAQLAFLAYLVYKTPYIITRRVALAIKKNFFTQAMYHNASRVVAISNAVKQTVTEMNKNINVPIIPSAMSDLQVNKDSSQAIKNSYSDKFLIGHIGELDNSTKGQGYILEAAKNLQKSHPDIHFIFLGKGKDEALFKQQTRGLDNVTFTGFVSNVGDYIAAFDLFVFPSLHEGLGSILFDVMQAQVPIIATEVGGIPDIITHEKNGLLLPPKDSSAIKNAVLHLYQHKDKARLLAMNAFEDIDDYGPKKMAQKYINIYQQLGFLSR